MASNTFGGGSSFGGSGGAFGGGYSGGGSSGSSSILGNLGKDIVSTVEGFGPGLVQLVEHPVKTGGAIVQNYKDTYGPLFHGDLGTFWQHVREHPLGPILDATALLDFGASGIGRAANLTAKAGEEGSLLKHLVYRPGEIRTALPGTDNGFIKATSANPLRRARQTGINKIMQTLPTKLRFAGTTNQYLRPLRSVSQNAVASHINLLATQGRAFDALKNTTERSVANALGHGLEFGDKKGSYLHNIKTENPGVEIPDEMKNLMTNPDAVDLVNRIKTQVKSGEVVDKDVKRVLAYNEASKLAADADAAIKGLDKKTANLRTYQHVMAQRGGRYLPKDTYYQTLGGDILRSDEQGAFGHSIVNPKLKPVDLSEVDPNALKELTPSEAHDALLQYGKLTKGAKSSLYAWMHPDGGEFDTEQLASDLAAEGHPGVHYVPDKTVFRNENPEGYAPRNPAFESSRGTTTNGMETYLHGQLLLNQNLLGREFLGSIHVAKANAMFDQLWEHGIKTAPMNIDDVLETGAEPKWGSPSKGFVYLKPKGEQYASHDPGEFLDRNRDEFQRLSSESPSLKSKARDYFKGPNIMDSTTFHPHEAAYGDGYLVQVPLHTVQQASKDIRQSQEGVLALLHKPTQTWKNFVLATRPGFLATNVIGNSLLYAMRHAGPEGAWALGRQIFERGDKIHSGISDSWVREQMPEQSIENTHTNTQIINREFAPSNFKRSFNKFLGTLYGINAKHEAMLRRASIDAAARSLPEIQERLRYVEAGLKNGRIDLKGKSKLEYAIQTSSEGVRRQISSMTDDVMGNYRDFSQGEQWMKELVPFYAWNRHAARTTASILGERPVESALLNQVGQQGASANQTILGDVPEFMRAYAPIEGSIPGLGAGPGEQLTLNTASYNPFLTVLQTAEAGKSLISGHPGQDYSELGSSINPLLGSVIEQFSGKSMLSGGPVKNDIGGGFLGAVARPFLSTGQIQMGEKLLGLTPAESPNSVTSHDWTTTGLGFLGAPIKKVRVAPSQAWEKKRKTTTSRGY